MTTVCWVVGAGGLLGAALCRAVAAGGGQLFVPQVRFKWDSPDALAAQFQRAVVDFATLAAAGGQWRLLWAAGAGSMGSTGQSMQVETRALSELLGCIQAAPALMSCRGTVLLASSAGGIYAGSTDPVITEHSVAAPTTPYASAKLDQEWLVRAFALRHGQLTALIARFSTLYGPGQTAAKPQGIISHIARRIVRNQPIQIYVPYDTIRDYLHVADAAWICVQALDDAEQAAAGVTTKIVASEVPSTIAEIISIFKRLTRRSPRVVTSASALSKLYLRRVVFRSVVQLGAAGRPPTTLMLGVADVLGTERLLFARGAGAS